MTIRWEVYRQIRKFPILEAAFLWLEIQPTKEMLMSPPYEVEKMKVLLHQELNKVARQKLQEELREIMSEGKSRSEAIKEIIYLTDELLINLCDLTDDEKKRHKAIVRKSPIPQSKINAWTTSEHPFDHPTSEELREVAELLNEKPKFLFLGEKERDSDDGWEQTAISKASYQTFIKVLLAQLKIDPKDRNAVGLIYQKVQEAGLSLSDTTIRKILDELEPSRRTKRK